MTSEGDSASMLAESGGSADAGVAAVSVPEEGRSSRRSKPIQALTRFSGQGALLVLIACYALQTLSPLRLNTDSIVLLSMADAAAHGGGFLDQGHNTVFPPGYPALLAVLLRSGLGHSSVIVGMNLLLLLGGLFVGHRILSKRFFRSRATSFKVCSLSLLSYVFVKHFTMPVTDVAFFGIAMGCLAVVDHASTLKWGKEFVAFALPGWGLAILSIMMRRIGVALIPALVYAVVCSPEAKRRLKGIPVRNRFSVAAVLTTAALGTVLAVLSTSTLTDFTGAVGKSRLRTVLFQIPLYRVTELGELAINAPASKLPAAAQVVVPVIGLAALSMIIGGLLTKRRDFGAVEVFFGSYLCVLFAWPYYDVRFWLPVVPLLIGYSGLAIRQANDRKHVAVVASIYCSAFVLAGAVALGFSTRISLARSKFPDLYGDRSFRSSYCAAFQTCSGPYSANEADPKVVKLLRMYR
jgi:hypothetical protein